MIDSKDGYVLVCLVSENNSYAGVSNGRCQSVWTGDCPSFLFTFIPFFARGGPGDASSTAVWRYTPFCQFRMPQLKLHSQIP